MVGFIECISKIAPIYNVAFSIIVFYLLLKLISMKRHNKNVFIKPWYLLFAAISVFVLEEIFTILKFFGFVTEAVLPRWFNAVFELIMVVLFIYMLFMQINHISEEFPKKKKT